MLLSKWAAPAVQKVYKKHLQKEIRNVKRLPFQSDISEGDSSKWCLPDGALFRLGQGRVNDMTLSPDGTLLAIASSLGLWWYDLTTCMPVTLFETERGMVDDIVLCSSQPWLALKNSDKDGNEVIKIWDMQRHKCIAVMAV